MTEFRISVDIAEKTNRVWEVLSDIERWHEWTSTVTSITPVERGPLAAGTKFWIRQPKLRPALWKVTALDEGRSFVWETRSPGVVVAGHHSIEDRGAGTRVTLSLQFSGPLSGVVAWVTKGLNNRYLATEAAGLKRHCEGVIA